jgi:hypothetical protein
LKEDNKFIINAPKFENDKIDQKDNNLSSSKKDTDKILDIKSS